jgi:hypothetical protein
MHRLFKCYDFFLNMTKTYFFLLLGYFMVSGCFLLQWAYQYELNYLTTMLS